MRRVVAPTPPLSDQAVLSRLKSMVPESIPDDAVIEYVHEVIDGPLSDQTVNGDAVLKLEDGRPRIYKSYTELPQEYYQIYKDINVRFSDYIAPEILADKSQNKFPLLLDMARNDLAFFTKYYFMFTQRMGMDEYIDCDLSRWFDKFFTEVLEIRAKDEPQYYIISIPPGSGKTLYCQAFCAFLMCNSPKKEDILLASGGFDLTSKNSSNIKEFLDSDFVKFLYGDLKRTDAKDKAYEWQIEETGNQIKCLTVNKSGFGQRASMAVLDDMNPNIAATTSADYKSNESAVAWFDQTLEGRFAIAVTPCVIIIQARLSNNDVPGLLMSKHPNKFTYIPIPFYCEDETTDPLKRKKGERISPERITAKKAEAIRNSKDIITFMTQYQCHPEYGTGNNLIKHEMINYYKYLDKPKAFDKIVLSVDSPLGLSETSDKCGMCVVGKANGRYYFLDVYNERGDVNQVMTQIKAMVAKWRPQAVLIEDAAAGKPIIDMLDPGRQKPDYIVPMKTGGNSKEARYKAHMEGKILERQIWLPDPKDAHTDKILQINTTELENQIFNLGHTKYDDILDAGVYALAYLHSKSTFTDTTAVIKQAAQLAAQRKFTNNFRYKRY